MKITVKSTLLAAPPGPVERLFNGDDATDFFKGVTRVTDDLRKVQILAAMRQDGAIALPEVTEVEGCIAIAPNEQGEPTVPINVSLPLVEATWPHMAATTGSSSAIRRRASGGWSRRKGHKAGLCHRSLHRC